MLTCPEFQAVGVMASGDQLKRVTCIGDGPSGMLAILCGAWAGLNNPMANVEVFTFNTPWVSTSPPLASVAGCHMHGLQPVKLT